MKRTGSLRYFHRRRFARATSAGSRIAYRFHAGDEGHGIVDAPRMYQLIRQHAPVETRTVEIEFRDPGAEVYGFTFG